MGALRLKQLAEKNAADQARLAEVMKGKDVKALSAETLRALKEKAEGRDQQRAMKERELREKNREYQARLAEASRSRTAKTTSQGRKPIDAQPKQRNVPDRQGSGVKNPRSRSRQGSANNRMG